MDKLFNPQSVAIIGASRHKDKIGYQILSNLINSGYKGKIFPVNPNAESILNYKTYKQIGDIEESVDLSVVVVPASIVTNVLLECVKKEVGYAIIISSGFSEIGQSGQALQDEIKTKIVENSPLRIIGPNCLGIINTSENLNLTFAAPKLTYGAVSAVFQSGALGASLLDWAQKFEFGFAKFVSLGNKVDLEESEIMEYLANDEATKVIALYIEEISEPSKFFSKARAAAKKKPVVILKGGTTALGARAAFSHTAAMISPAHINKAIFSQANLLVAKSIEEMLSIISILSCEPPVKSKTLAIVTNAGGPGILATDAASNDHFELPEPDKEALKKALGETAIASLANPLDLTGAALAKDYETALNYFAHNDRFASIMIIMTPQSMTEIEQTAQAISRFANLSKPVISSFLGDKTVEKGVDILIRNKCPHFEEPSEAIAVLSKVVNYWNKHDAQDEFIDLKKAQDAQQLPKEALELIKNYNIPTAEGKIAKTAKEAESIFSQFNAPVAVKNASHDVVHKFKAGKVVLNVASTDQLQKAIGKVALPVLIQKMIESPIELIIGAKRDLRLGILITFGWGGVFTEDLKDISTRIVPLTENALDEMIEETKVGAVLIKEGYNIGSIKDIILRVGQIMTDFEDIVELELNPIKASRDSLYCVDARYKIMEPK